jgi:hypothetical protein
MDAHRASTRSPLALRKERLTELTSEELASVAGGRVQPTPPATVGGITCLGTLRACLTGTETQTCLCTTPVV